MFAMGPAFFGRASAPATLALSGTFPAATVGVAYDEYLTISGGVTPYSLTGGTGLASGSLPAGLSLSIDSTTHLRLSGTPTTSGTATFTASVDSTDSQTATSAQSIAVAAGATTYTAAVLSDSPVAYYRCDDNASNNAVVPAVGSPGFNAVLASGASGTANTSTVTTAGLLAGAADAAFSFSAAQYIRAPALAASFASLTVWTFECVYNAIVVPYYGTLVQSGPVASGSTGSLEVNAVDAGSGKYYLRFMQSGVGQVASTPNYNLGTKVHLAVVRNGATDYVYINGTLLASFANVWTMRTTDTWRFGAGSFSGTDGQYPFAGVLDEIAVYGTALSGARIAAHAALI